MRNATNRNPMTVIPVKRLALASAIAMSLAVAAVAQNNPNQPFPPPGQADRVAVSSSSLELIEAQQTPEGPFSEPVELLRASFDVRAASAPDLVIRVDAECAAWLDEEEEDEPVPEDLDDELTPAQDEEDEQIMQVSGASVVTWVELNGEPVPVDFGGMEFEDDGTVVLCSAQGSTDLHAEDEELIEQYARSRSSGGFTWTAGDVGQGFHEVVLFAAIDLHADPVEDEEENGDDDNGNDNGVNGDSHADALAIIGKRLMIVERARVAQIESF